MALESVESNEHSIRFKVLEEVPLVAVVEHILMNASGGAATPDQDSAGRARALELLQIGAVYVGIPQKGLDYINWVRSSDLPVAVTVATVPYGNYVRVHPHPKRYPACYCKDWPSRVLHCDEDYVVVNKPAGLPCMRHESNAVEELASCVGRALGMEGLEVCHRLDQWTTGVVVLSRNKEANKAFKRSLQDREAGLVKTYKALSYSPVPLGPLEHHMYDGPFNEGAPVLGGGNLRPRGPRLLSRTAHERWRVCRLEVRGCREHTGALEWYRRNFPGPHDEAFAAASRAAGSPSPSDCWSPSGQPPPQQQQQQVPPVVRQQQPTAQLQLQPQQPTAQLPHGTQQQQQHEQGQGQGQQPGQQQQQQQGEQQHQRGGTPAAPSQPARLYESTIDLHTGRTHQIRAQLASVGCPLVGDIMYAPIKGLLVGESGVLEDPDLVSLVEQLPMLERHIGLHAWRLSWRGHVFEAPPDWGAE